MQRVHPEQPHRAAADRTRPAHAKEAVAYRKARLAAAFAKRILTMLLHDPGGVGCPL